jgi:hypothetical protein
MPRKRHQPEGIVAKLRQVDVLTSRGRSVADAIRSIGVTEVTYHGPPSLSGQKSIVVDLLDRLRSRLGRNSNSP